MARCRVANEVDGLQVWSVTVNILNTQSQTRNIYYGVSYRTSYLATSSEEHRLREFSTKTHAYVYNCLSSLHVVELTTREIRDPYFLSPEEVRCWPLTPT